MFQAAAGFSAGLFAGHGLGACREGLPGCRIRGPADGLGQSFRISVRVLGASSTELSAPGVVARPQPRLEVSLGEVQKQTEAAVFCSSAASSYSGPATMSGTSLHDVLACSSAHPGDRSRREAACADNAGAASTAMSRSWPSYEALPWQFDDTLTFAARPHDLLGDAGLRLRLRVTNEVCIGPLQVQMPNVQDLGEASLDLRREVLAKCTAGYPPDLPGAAAPRPGGLARKVWHTPELVVPLWRAADRELPKAMSRVLVSVSVNADPQALLRQAELAERGLVDRVVGQAVTGCVGSAPAVACDADGGLVPFCCAAPATAAAAAAPCRACRARSPRPYMNTTRGNPQDGGCGAIPGEEEGADGFGAGAYANCEVPASLVGGGSGAWPSQDEFDGANGLNGLWPAPPAAQAAAVVAGAWRSAPVVSRRQ